MTNWLKDYWLKGLIFIVVVGLSIFVFYKITNKPWMLSLYGDGTTTMRLDYLSKEDCLSAGRSYLAEKSAERFDCGYKCSSFNKIDLKDSPICKQVCNQAGCR